MSRPGIVLPEPVSLPEHELLARIFRTLGDATRLRIIESLLQHKDSSQKQLTERIGATQSRMSEHLSCLVWCGLVSVTRQGRSARYRVDGPDAQQLVGLARRFLDENPNAVGGCTPLVEGGSGSHAMASGVL